MSFDICESFFVGFFFLFFCSESFLFIVFDFKLWFWIAWLGCEVTGKFFGVWIRDRLCFQKLLSGLFFLQIFFLLYLSSSRLGFFLFWFFLEIAHVHLSRPASPDLHIGALWLVLCGGILFGHERLPWFLDLHLLWGNFGLIWNLFDLNIVTGMLSMTDRLECFLPALEVIIDGCTLLDETFLRFRSDGFLLKLVERWSVVSENVLRVLWLIFLLCGFLLRWVYYVNLIQSFLGWLLNLILTFFLGGFFCFNKGGALFEAFLFVLFL